MWNYFFFQILLPASLFFVVSTVVLALFGRSLGVRRLYVRALLNIFQYARRVARQKARKSNFLVGSVSDNDEDTEDEEDLSDPSSSSPSPGWDLGNLEGEQCEQNKKDIGDQVDPVPPPKRISRHVSRHNVISRKDDLILNPVHKVFSEEMMHDDTEAEHKDCAQSEGKPSIPEKLLHGKVVSLATFQREFDLCDVLDYVRSGVSAIIEDEVTQRFEAEELKSWNLLTRTNDNFEFLTWELSTFYWVGFVFRYCFLLPGRLLILLVGLLYMAIGMSLIGPLKDGPVKRWLNYQITTSCFQVLGGALSLVVNYHDVENRPKGGICVANHTTPIDIMTLACDNAYALTGQRHGGFNGYFQDQLSKASPQIWFERGESKDRKLVVQRLKEHVDNPDRLPILIFPRELASITPA